MSFSFDLHSPDGFLQCEPEVPGCLGEPGGAEGGEQVTGANKGGGELGDVDPDLGPDPAHPGARQAEQELLVTELSAGEDDGGGPHVVQQLHHLPGLLLGGDLLVCQQLGLELIGQTDVGQGQDLALVDGEELRGDVEAGAGVPHHGVTHVGQGGRHGLQVGHHGGQLGQKAPVTKK